MPFERMDKRYGLQRSGRERAKSELRALSAVGEDSLESVAFGMRKPGVTTGYLLRSKSYLI